MCGNRAQDATKSHTHTEDAQDAQDANWTSLASGCKADVSDAPYIFADGGTSAIDLNGSGLREVEAWEQKE